MLSENLKQLRKQKGLSQGELATKLNVVRQTVSKWEQGLSVPDSEMLIRIADALDTSVNIMLGEVVPQSESDDLKIIAAKLETLNEQFAQSNERKRKTWRIVFIVVAVISACAFLSGLVSCIYTVAANHALSNGSFSTGIIGGYDGPTSIYVSSVPFRAIPLIVAGVALVVSIVGIARTKRH